MLFHSLLERYRLVADLQVRSRDTWRLRISNLWNNILHKCRWYSGVAFEEEKRLYVQPCKSSLPVLQFSHCKARGRHLIHNWQTVRRSPMGYICGIESLSVLRSRMPLGDIRHETAVVKGRPADHARSAGNKGNAAEETALLKLL